MVVNLFFFFKNSESAWMQSTSEGFKIPFLLKPSQLLIHPHHYVSSPQLVNSESGVGMVPNESNATAKVYKGVAVCLFLHTPTWFQRRYTMMIRNIRDNIPPDWIVQVFYTGEGQSLNGIKINYGLQRMIDSHQIILTTIPKEISKIKRKQYEIWTERWIWENMLSDQVLTFGGSASLCGNSRWNVTDFLSYDYIGAPWNVKGG